MTDNLEQLEKDWPQPRPKKLSTRGLIKMFLAMAILFSAIIEIDAVLLILRLKSLHVQDWYLKATILEMAVLLPGASAFVSYRRVKAAIIASGGSQALLHALQYHGVMLLFMIYLVVWLIFSQLRF